MARLVMCGWESGSPGEIGISTVSGGASALNIQSAARNGSYALRAYCPTSSNGTAWLRVTLLPVTPSEIYVRLGVKVGVTWGFTDFRYDLLRVLDTGTVQVAIRGDASDNTFKVLRGDGTTLGTLASGLGIGAWHCLEARFKIDNGSGVVTVWIDGTQVMTYSGDTQQSGAAQITDVDFGAIRIQGTNSSWTVDVDDFAVNDTTGTVNTGRIGQGGIIALRPSADTAQKDFSRSTGSDNFELVNEAQVNDDTDYVYSGTLNNRDLYDLQNLGSTAGTVSAVAVVGVMKSDGGAGAQAALTIKSDDTTQDGSTKTLTTNYASYIDVYDKNPDTDAQWTPTEVNALQAGVTVK